MNALDYARIAWTLRNESEKGTEDSRETLRDFRFALAMDFTRTDPSFPVDSFLRDSLPRPAYILDGQ